MNALKTRKRVMQEEEEKRLKELPKLTDEERKKIEAMLRFTDAVSGMTRGGYK